MKRLFNNIKTQKNLATNAAVANNQHSFFSYWGVRKTYNNLGLIVKQLLALFVVNSNNIPQTSWINNFNKTYTKRTNTYYGYAYLIVFVLYFFFRVIFS